MSPNGRDSEQSETSTAYESSETEPLQKRTGNEIDFASFYDYCIIFPVDDYNFGTFTPAGNEIIQTLRFTGFKLFCYRGNLDRGHLYVLLRATPDVLRNHAMLLQYHMKLDPAKLRELVEHGQPARYIPPVTIAHRPDITPYRPYEEITMVFNEDFNESLFYCENNSGNPFSDRHRLKITELVLEEKYDNHSINIRGCMTRGSVVDVFPLHNLRTKEELKTLWSKYPLKKLPLHEIKEYFGERIGLYFAFTEYFVTCLWLPTIVGVAVQVLIKVDENRAAWLRPGYSLFITIWSVVIMEVSKCWSMVLIT